MDSAIQASSPNTTGAVSGGAPTTARQRVLVGLVATLAVIAFIESYQGLYRAAIAGGRPWPWLWPCAVEGFTLAMNVAIWDARSRRRRAPWSWALLILATAVSTALQVLDAPHVWLGWLTAAWTPVALLLSFERWMWLVYGHAPASAETPEPAETPAAPAPSRPPSRRERMRAWVLAERAEGRDPTGADVDAEFGTNNYGRRIVRELAATNGHPERRTP
jgi:hypothetical protein